MPYLSGQIQIILGCSLLISKEQPPPILFLCTLQTNRVSALKARFPSLFFGPIGRGDYSPPRPLPPGYATAQSIVQHLVQRKKRCQQYGATICLGSTK